MILPSVRAVLKTAAAGPKGILVQPPKELSKGEISVGIFGKDLRKEGEVEEGQRVS